MSYTQLAAARAISKESAIRLARRERWRKMPGNDADKTVRVLVPQAYLQPTARPDALPVTREDVPQGELSRLISMFETGLVTLREQLAVANGRAEAAERGRDGERQRADDAEADARELRAHAAAFNCSLPRPPQPHRRARNSDRQMRPARRGASWRGSGRRCGGGSRQPLPVGHAYAYDRFKLL